MPATRTPRGRRLPVTLARSLTVIAVSLAVATLACLVHPAPASALTGVVPDTYPRVGIWWPNPAKQPIADIARYDFVALTPAQLSAAPAIRQRHPGCIVLASVSACEPDLSRLDEIPASWLLTQVGSTLSGTVTSSQRTFPVRDSGRFRTGDLVVVGDEVATVDGIASGSLTVRRGTHRPASSHAANTRVAALVTYWPGSAVADLSSYCPRAVANPAVGAETWAEYQARTCADLLDANPSIDGLLIDRTDGNESWLVGRGSIRTIDPARSNSAVTDGYRAFDSAWNGGLTRLESGIRAREGGRIVLGNNAYPNMGLLNGTNFEGFPMASGDWYGTPWADVVLSPDRSSGSYVDWTQHSLQPNLTTIMTFEDDSMDVDGSAPYDRMLDPSFVPDYRKMRYGLTTSLLGNGFFSYEVSTRGHGALGLMWFDEYGDPDHRGYLGRPLGDARSAEPTPSGTDLLSGDGRFDSSADLDGWQLWNDEGSSATRRLDDAERAVGSSSLKVDVLDAPENGWQCCLLRRHVPVVNKAEYTLSFWARADRARHIRALVLGDQDPYSKRIDFTNVAIGTQWRRYEIRATCIGGDDDARLEFDLGEVAGTVWLDDVTLLRDGRAVMRRDYQGGVALVNPSDAPRTFDVGPGFKHLSGTQAPSPNDGLPARTVTIPARDGVVLVRDDGTPSPHVTLAGSTRYETALAVSRQAFAAGSCDTVVLATGGAFPDALAAAGLAGAADCPVLLVKSSAPTPELKAEISRLTGGRPPATIYIVGGTGAVSANMEESLEDLYPNVKRLAGANRYATAQVVAAEVPAALASHGAQASGRAFVVTGADFPDALLVGPVAYARHMPILLLGNVDASLKQALDAAGVTDVTIVGSTSSVSTAAEQALKTYLGAEHVTRPCGGADRYETAVEVAAWASQNEGFGWRTVALATGAAFPDALGAAALQGKDRSVLLITQPTSLDSAVRAALASHAGGVETVRFLGGTGALSTKVRDSVEAAVGH